MFLRYFLIMHIMTFTCSVDCRNVLYLPPFDVVPMKEEHHSVCATTEAHVGENATGHLPLQQPE